jgi:hypothetical protein
VTYVRWPVTSFADQPANLWQARHSLPQTFKKARPQCPSGAGLHVSLRKQKLKTRHVVRKEDLKDESRLEIFMFEAKRAKT